ncbi:MAG: NAD(P)/FAD-dependent oxidoreductase [Calditrichaeota bacterium]|nr:NAD(P)/FAD-dependent oxidoreductase [Calditrichota bacterium]
MKSRTIHIIGAGPAGLVAAINLAKAGYDTIVHEKHDDVGSRFNGDFQGIENWSSANDAMSFLKKIGLQVNFLCAPHKIGHFYGPNLKEVKIKTRRPLFYLIERGVAAGSFDQGLKQQALAAGVQFLWNDKIEKVPSEITIVGTGPKAADVIAKGIIFKTSHPDAYYGFLDDRIAPKGYAYLLVNNQRATFATCMFEDFRNSRIYFERALKTMRKIVNIDIKEPAEFGGFGNFFLPSSGRKNDKSLYVGETAGFQDALWGFGLRYALLSGYLAAQSIISGRNFDRLCRQYILPSLKTSLANRWFFAHLGNHGYRWVLNRLNKSGDAINILQKHHQLSFSKQLLFWLAKRWYHTRLIDKQCMHKDCDCIWCRCG